MSQSFTMSRSYLLAFAYNLKELEQREKGYSVRIFATFATVEDSFLPNFQKSLPIPREALTHSKELHKSKKSIAKLLSKTVH